LTIKKGTPHRQVWAFPFEKLKNYSRQNYEKMTVQTNPNALSHEGLASATKYKGYYYCKVLEGRGWFVLNSAGESIHETTYQHEAKDYITELVNLEKEQQEAHHQADFQEISKESEDLENSAEKTIEERTDEANDSFDSLNQEQLWELLESVEEVKEIQIINRYHQSERAYIYQVRAFKYDVFNGLFFWQSEAEQLGDSKPRPFFCTAEEAETNAQNWSLQYNMEAEEMKKKEGTEKEEKQESTPLETPVKSVFDSPTEELAHANSKAIGFSSADWKEFIVQAEVNQKISHQVGDITVYELENIFPFLDLIDTLFFWDTPACPVSSQENPFFLSTEDCALAILKADLRPKKAPEKEQEKNPESQEKKAEQEAHLRLLILKELQTLQKELDSANSKLAKYDRLFNSGDDIQIKAVGINSGVEIRCSHEDMVNAYKDFVYGRGQAHKTEVVNKINALSF